MGLLGSWCNAEVDAALRKIDQRIADLDARWAELQEKQDRCRGDQVVSHEMDKMNREAREAYAKALKKDNDLLRAKLDDLERRMDRMETIATALYANLERKGDG